MKSVDQKVNDYFGSVKATLDRVDTKSMSALAQLFLETYKNDGTIFVFGNGGSGATASHFCGDFVKGVSHGLDKRFKMICLNDNSPTLLAVANDISYDAVFVEPLKNFLKRGDLVIGISGSGNSMNVVNALEHAKSVGAKTVALCGYNGGKIKMIADVAVHADIADMEVSEDVHLIITHCIKRIVTDELNNGKQVKSC